MALILYLSQPALEAWARQQVPGEKAELSVELRELEPGSLVYVLGHPVAHDGVMVMKNRPMGELMFSSLTEEQLRALLEGRSRGRRMAWLVAVGVTVLGVLLIGLELLT